ncbi:MAG: AbrB family transcriptional regulator [Comamonadaceae bacterium]|nr:MAG: AbrB family transcriptional regulator [Comamonadaceae bacterium]
MRGYYVARRPWRVHHTSTRVPLLPAFGPTSWRRVVLTLLLALAAALLCVWLRTPIPWMIGPLLATSLVSVLGVPTESWTPLRNSGQWVIGTALGLYFTPAVGALVAGLWWAIALGIAWALLLGLGFGAWLRRLHAGHLAALSPAELRSTTYFAGAIGGASEMTLIAERQGARTDLVAAAHSLRVLLVTVTIPFALQFWGVSGLDTLTPGLREVQPAGLLALAGLTLLGALLMQWLGRANPWFMGALVVTMAVTLSGITLSAIPQPLSNAAQLVIGVSLGVRFTPAFVHTAPRWLASVAFASFFMMGLCAVFGWVLSRLTGLHPATLLLGTAPGGIAEMAITAKVLQLGVPVVTAFQVCRLVAVLVLAEPVYRWRYARA